MAEGQLREFLLMLSRDSDLSEKIKSAENPDEVLAIANESGFDITKTELLESASRKLSEDELKDVAGGKGFSGKSLKPLGRIVKGSRDFNLSKKELEAGPTALPCELATVPGTYLFTCTYSTHQCGC